MVLVDKEGRIIALFGARPDDEDYKKLIVKVSEVIESARRRCKFADSRLNHRRGSHASLSKGASHGGGSKVSLPRSSSRIAPHRPLPGARHSQE